MNEWNQSACVFVYEFTQEVTEESKGEERIERYYTYNTIRYAWMRKEPERRTATNAQNMEKAKVDLNLEIHWKRERKRVTEKIGLCFLSS